MDPQHERMVRQVLAGLTYPAEKWQILTQAELYGADVGTVTELHRLPAKEYRSPTEVTSALNGE